MVIVLKDRYGPHIQPTKERTEIVQHMTEAQHDRYVRANKVSYDTETKKFHFEDRHV